MIELYCEYFSVQWIWLYVLFISITRFSVNAHPIVAWISSNSLLDIQSLSDCNRTQTHNHLDGKWKLNHLVKVAKWLSCLVSTYLYSAFDCIFLQSHLTVYSKHNCHLVSLAKWLSGSLYKLSGCEFKSNLVYSVSFA